MSLVSLLLKTFQDRTAFRENGSDEDILLVDATIQRTTSYENDITMFPVENGPDITDHIRTKPITMQIDGVISNTPLSVEAQKAALVTSGGSFVNKTIGGFKGASAAVGAGSGKLGSKLFDNGGSPAELARKKLEGLIFNRAPIRISVGKKILDNMVMTRLSIPEDNQTGQAFKFSATFQQIRIVTGQTVIIEKIAQKSAHTAAKKTDLGAQATTEVKKEQRTSILKNLSNKVFGLFGGG